MSSATAVAVALIFVYVIHYVCHVLARLGKANLKEADVEERAKKLYLYGIVALLSVHFVSVYGAVLAWFTFLSFAAYYGTMFIADEEKKKKLFSLTGLAYTGFLTVWWIGQTVDIFMV